MSAYTRVLPQGFTDFIDTPSTNMSIDVGKNNADAMNVWCDSEFKGDVEVKGDMTVATLIPTSLSWPLVYCIGQRQAYTPMAGDLTEYVMMDVILNQNENIWSGANEDFIVQNLTLGSVVVIDISAKMHWDDGVAPVDIGSGEWGTYPVVSFGGPDGQFGYANPGLSFYESPTTQHRQLQMTGHWVWVQDDEEIPTRAFDVVLWNSNSIASATLAYEDVYVSIMVYRK